MPQIDAVQLFKCLADKSRLAILNNLIKEPMYVELLAERLSITPSTVSFHLKKLMDAGFVYSRKEQYYVIYEVNPDILSSTLYQLVKADRDDVDEQMEREEIYRKKVIDHFFKYDKLITIPVQRKKARIVYEEILKAFDKEKEYTEKEVNIIIADFNDDFCTIRKNMVEDKLLERENSRYRVIG
ncbi:DUF2087 domain-containing protein [Anaeromicropila herbilytica]|uniref:HTH arsR-type domain-containing protein n=1 Tax=Anaeromicropila herbilytica TaxID=2785025 RepID=A0A7R7EK40_9FIRM|nr:metalloregulator ArsR/SmtB family transcription factor [Anaeromicropila herbilytica]BCN30234.1 hypothetical protein bsdtb5_15290 [Anaeromicropila herbilytica]